jgi:polysaccharide biosynthesis PFTS motif protein
LISKLTKYHSRRLRRIMRGYRLLKKSDSLNRIANIKLELTISSLNISTEKFSKYIFGKGKSQAELVCRQYLLARIAGVSLNRALLSAVGKPGASLVYYLPPEWRKIIQAHGYKLAPFRSAVLWKIFLWLMLAHGLLRITKIILKGVKATFNPLRRMVQLGRYVYFEELASGNLPQPAKGGSSHDIITWYMQWPNRTNDIDTLCHGVAGAEINEVCGVPVVQTASPIPQLQSFKSLFQYIAWGIGAFLIAAWGVLRGNWWHALMLNQAALATQVRLLRDDLLAKEYMFHNSDWIYRPLWTYEVEAKEAKLNFYLYSTNCELFQHSKTPADLNYGWQANNWPRYLVWDNYQADFIQRAVGDSSDIQQVGPIWFSTSAKEMPKLNGQCIAVFDVTPVRSSFYQIFSADFDYYIPEVCLSFLQDIQKISDSYCHTMLWKRKRDIGTRAHPKYRNYTQKLLDCQNVVGVDPEISAVRVIEASSLVISMPFTSTALIARELDKPSCFYDPTGMVYKRDKAAHGIDILCGFEELASWVKAKSETHPVSPKASV